MKGLITNTISAVCQAKQFVIPAVILLTELIKNTRKMAWILEHT